MQLSSSASALSSPALTGDLRLCPAHGRCSALLLRQQGARQDTGRQEEASGALGTIPPWELRRRETQEPPQASSNFWLHQRAHVFPTNFSSFLAKLPVSPTLEILTYIHCNLEPLSRVTLHTHFVSSESHTHARTHKKQSKTRKYPVLLSKAPWKPGWFLTHTRGSCTIETRTKNTPNPQKDPSSCFTVQQDGLGTRPLSDLTVLGTLVHPSRLR